MQQPIEHSLNYLSSEYRDPHPSSLFFNASSPVDYNDEASYSPSATTGAQQGYDDSQFFCSFDVEACSQIFRTAGDLNIHMKVHYPPFECTIPACRGLSFRYHKDLTRHEREVHGTTQYYCPVETCKHSEAYGVGINRPANLDRHVLKAHPKLPWAPS